jgi:hypothetical protein
VAASSFPSVVSRKARAFQPAAETSGGEGTLRLLTLKSNQGPIRCERSFQGEDSSFAFERALIGFMRTSARCRVHEAPGARPRPEQRVSEAGRHRELTGRR